MFVDLLAPIPDQTQARFTKLGYRDVFIDHTHWLHNDPLVPISEYGLEGVSRYSRPSYVFDGDAVEGVSPHVFVRKMYAEKLAAVDKYLRTSDDVARALGDRAKLFVDDGNRTPELAQLLKDAAMPNLYRKLHPNWTEEQIVARCLETIGDPACTPESMPAHVTGGAGDLAMRFLDSGAEVDIIKDRIAFGEEVVNPDFFENLDERLIIISGLSLAKVRMARVSRRVLYNLMTSREVGGADAVVNPTEAWHYEYLTQMWSRLKGKNTAVYGLPPTM